MKKILKRIIFPFFLVCIFPLWNTSFVILDPPEYIGPKKKKISKKVRATVYHPVPNQTSPNPDLTASGKRINLDDPYSHRWIAISRDLEKYFKFGDTVIITGTNGVYDGEWVVNDRMNKRWKSKIDFLIGWGNRVSRFKDVTITKK